MCQTMKSTKEKTKEGAWGGPGRVRAVLDKVAGVGLSRQGHGGNSRRKGGSLVALKRKSRQG